MLLMKKVFPENINPDTYETKQYVLFVSLNVDNKEKRLSIVIF